MSGARLTPHDERRVAVEAGVDPRTVRAFIRGARQSEAVKRAVRAAFEGCGVQVPQPRDGETPQPEAGKAER